MKERKQQGQSRSVEVSKMLTEAKYAQKADEEAKVSYRRGRRVAKTLDYSYNVLEVVGSPNKNMGPQTPRRS